MEVLVTGGAGYIGSTICSALSDNGYKPIIMDSLVTGQASFVRDFEFVNADIADRAALEGIKKKYPKLSVVVHCAARIIVGESLTAPYLYYRENVTKSLEFFKNCAELGIDKILFSSSASVYDTSNTICVDETSRCDPLSPYAATKFFMEKILADICLAHDLSGVSLRYFNPIGADPQFRTGPFIKDPSHLLGSLLKARLRPEKSFSIFGDDWPTRDGTPIRDFIHIWDLALAHLKGIEYLNSGRMSRGSHDIINVGTGLGTTVKEFTTTFLEVSGETLKVQIGERRPGDAAGAYASTIKAREVLGWTAQKSIREAIADSLEWSKRFKN